MTQKNVHKVEFQTAMQTTDKYAQVATLHSASQWITQPVFKIQDTIAIIPTIIEAAISIMTSPNSAQQKIHIIAWTHQGHLEMPLNYNFKDYLSETISSTLYNQICNNIIMLQM